MYIPTPRIAGKKPNNYIMHQLTVGDNRLYLRIFNRILFIKEENVKGVVFCPCENPSGVLQHFILCFYAGLS